MSNQLAQWQSDLARLKGQLDRAHEAREHQTGKLALPAQATQAGLTELAAVKQYNDFLATSRRLNESVRQLDARLRNDTSMSSLERTNLVFLRWTPSCRPHYALRSHLPDAMSL